MLRDSKEFVMHESHIPNTQPYNPPLGPQHCPALKFTFLMELISRGKLKKFLERIYNILFLARINPVKSI